MVTQPSFYFMHIRNSGTMTILSLKNLVVGYAEKVVMRDLSLDLKEGEFVSLLGPSGSGKSSILRAVAGFLPLISGKIVLNGRDITPSPPERRNIGIVFQNYALFPNMTAFENIAFSLRVAKRPKVEIDSRVTAIAMASGIGEQLYKKPASMSGGQQQRVAIARALVTGSKVLLFDEPLSNLDARVRVAMRAEIKRLQDEFGFAAIFVTHDQEDALTMSDKIIVLSGGRVEQVGDGHTLYHKPISPFVCQFIGNSNELSLPLAQRLIGEDVDGRSFVRLEDVILGDETGQGIGATVTHVEFLGAYSRIDCDVQGHLISAFQLGDQCPGIGQAVTLSIRPGSEILFKSGHE